MSLSLLALIAAVSLTTIFFGLRAIGISYFRRCVVRIAARNHIATTENDVEEIVFSASTDQLLVVGLVFAILHVFFPLSIEEVEEHAAERSEDSVLRKLLRL